MNPLLLWGAAAVLLFGAALSALLSAAETVILTLRDYQVRALVARRPAIGPIVARWSRDPQRHLIPIIALSSGTHFAIAGAAFLLLRESGLLEPLSARRVVQIVAVAVATTFLFDFLPKCFALRWRNQAVCLAASTVGFLRPLRRIPGGPILRSACGFATTRLIRLIPRRQPVLHDEVTTLIGLAAARGTITEDERGVMLQILDLSRKTVRDCMIPRMQTPAIHDSLPVREVRDLAATCPGRFLPVFHRDRDDIVGLLDLRSFLAGPQCGVAEAMFSPRFVPETTEVLDFLSAPVNRNESPAIVLDEHGAFEGTLSGEALLQQLFWGLPSAKSTCPDIQELAPGQSFLVRGATRLETLSRHSGGSFVREGIDTVAGLVFTELGRLPEGGEEVCLNGFVFRVRKTAGNRIEEVLVERTAL
ncbi:MAG TPA: transporter associated domain-containing protein [Verrucomicrobiales bacterium]|nr:transporter associated domain-containing protein [Verrucomicrobiales bacterium]